MLKLLLVTYVCLYGLMMIALSVVPFLPVPAGEKRDEWWETLLDLVLAAAGLAGMIFFLTDYDPPALKNAWKVVSVALVGAQLYLNLKGRIAYARRAGEKDKFAAGFSDVFTLTFLVPSLVVNLLYAFG